MSSPVASLVNGCLEQIGAGSEFFTFFDEQKRKDICLSLFNAYYKDRSEFPVILILIECGQRDFINWLNYLMILRLFAVFGILPG